METWKQYISPQMDSSIYPKKMVNMASILTITKGYAVCHNAFKSLFST